MHSEMNIYSDGALRGFVSVVPRWFGYSSEDYNRASLRAYGVEEAELVRLGGVVETKTEDRGQQIMGKEGQKATENETFQYRTNIDSDDYAMFPEATDIQEDGEEEEQLTAFAEQIRKRQKELSALSVDKRQFGPYDLSGCEKIRAELCSLSDKVCFTIDRNGIIFNTCARNTLSMEELTECVEIAYNPVLQMLVVHKADEKDDSSLKWTRQDNSMRKCSCRGFSNALFDNMGWNLDYKYKVIGCSMEIDGETVLIFTLEDPIRIVPIKSETKTRVENRKNKGRETKELLEAGFAPEDFQMPSTMPDLGSEMLNEKAMNAAKNAAKSRATYYDNYTSASGTFHVSDLGDGKFDPECIRQIIQKNREPEEGWGYLKGMAVFHKNSFTIMPEVFSGDSFGDEVYSRRPAVRLEGRIMDGKPYGWVQSLTLPSRETVEMTIQILEEEMAV